MLDLTIHLHISSMGFHTVGEYQKWCSQNGFGTTLQKSSTRLKVERDKFETMRAINVLKNSNKNRNLKSAIALLRQGKKVDWDCRITDVCKNHSDIKWDLFNLFEFLEENSKIVRQTNLENLVPIVRKKQFWINDFKSWKSSSHNVSRQFSSLLRHLFVKYKMPLFMDKAWEMSHNHLEQEKFRDWYLLIGRGENIRTAKDLPLPLTKKKLTIFSKLQNIVLY